MVHKLLLAVFGSPMRCSRLESESANISASTNMLHPKSRVKLIVVFAVIAVSVVVGAFLVSAFISTPQGQGAWLFKGAYATYEGSTTMTSNDIGLYDTPMSFDFTVDFTVRLEAVDFNSTHALVSTYFRMSSSLGGTDGETIEDENSTWVPISQMNFINAFEDVDLTKSYESTVDISGFGTRTCMVYEYALSDDGLTMTVYVDKAIGWPLKMSLSTDEDLLDFELALDINIVETNIPALK
jgi:hypothetical protein